MKLAVALLYQAPLLVPLLVPLCWVPRVFEPLLPVGDWRVRHVSKSSSPAVYPLSPQRSLRP